MEAKLCNPSPECKYFNSPTGCFEDRHHIYQQAEADTSLKKRFCFLPSNTVVLCRVVHEEIEATEGWPEYPERAEMLEMCQRLS